jgi:hypothetical protein
VNVTPYTLRRSSKCINVYQYPQLDPVRMYDV